VAAPPGAVLPVRVTPRAPRDAVDGWRAGRLRIRTTASPVRGAANAAVCWLVASALRVPASSVRVIHGYTGRDKLIRISGLAREEVLRRLGSEGAR